MGNSFYLLKFVLKNITTMKTNYHIYQTNRFFLFLIVLLVFSSCMQYQYNVISPGRVKPGEELKKHNTTFTQVSKTISSQPDSLFEVIGHGAGSWRYYPMGINKKGVVYGNGFKNKETQAIHITWLIDQSIAYDPHMSIELDAQYPPDNHPIHKTFPDDGAYILHNTPEWEKDSKAIMKPSSLNYLHNNTIQKAVEHFVNKEYYKNCNMYIEIKVDKDCYDANTQSSDCKMQCQKLANELKNYALTYKTDNNKNWLCITSFSPLALQLFRDALPNELKDRFDYVLISGYIGGWFTAWAAQRKGYVPAFDSNISNFVIQTEWLDCVWFSVQGIKDYDTVFNDMITKRKTAHPTWQEVSFSYATYPKGKDKMIKLMTKGKTKLNAPIRSFMLDLDYEW